MTVRFKTFADANDNAKPVSDFDVQAFRERMKKIVRDAKRHHVRAVQSAREVFVGR